MESRNWRALTNLSTATTTACELVPPNASCRVCSLRSSNAPPVLFITSGIQKLNDWSRKILPVMFDSLLHYQFAGFQVGEIFKKIKRMCLLNSSNLECKFSIHPWFKITTHIADCSGRPALHRIQVPFRWVEPILTDLCIWTRQSSSCPDIHRLRLLNWRFSLIHSEGNSKSSSTHQLAAAVWSPRCSSPSFRRVNSSLSAEWIEREPGYIHNLDILLKDQIA